MFSTRHYMSICMISLICLDTYALAQDAATVLENLKRYDSIYEAGFTASGTQKGQDKLRLRPLRLIEVKRKWKLAFDSGRCGYSMEILEYEKPKFEKTKGGKGYNPIAEGGKGYNPIAKGGKGYNPIAEGGKGYNPIADGSQVLSIATRDWGYWGADCSGEFVEDTIMKVSPANEIEEVGKGHNSTLYGPKDAGPNIPKRTILWSLGRFYSGLLDEITDVRQSASGRITVSALGKRDAVAPGRWELEIEPAAAWMVREARHYGDANPKVIDCEMKNSGTAWSGAYCIPQEALFNYLGPISGGKGILDLILTSELTFDPVIGKFDEELYDSAKQAVTKDRPSNLTIFDYRVSPPLIFEPDKELKKVLDVPLSDVKLEKLADAHKDAPKTGKIEVTSASLPILPVKSPSVRSGAASALKERSQDAPTSLTAGSSAAPTRPAKWAKPIVHPDLKNSFQVSKNLYRSAQPTSKGFKAWKKIGVKTVINLRAFHSDMDELKGIALKLTEIPMTTWHPENEDVVRFLKIVSDESRGPFLVHCQHGSDRTGLMCAIYRVAVCGWTKDEALKEMTEGGFGFHPVWENLKTYLDKLDVDALKKQAGIMDPPKPANPAKPAGPR